MQTETIDLRADIVPNASLAGLSLRERVADIQQMIVGLGLYKPGRYELVCEFEARYTFEDGEVSVCVDVRNGKVFKIIVWAGYAGTLLGKIRVGMRIGDAMAIEPDLYYDEVEAGLLIAGHPGVMLNTAELDPEPAKVPFLSISSISVFATEIDQLGGQMGEW